MPRPTSWLASTFALALLGAAPLTARAAQCAQLPVLFIIQDTSGSMAQSPDPGVIAQSKWEIASATVPQLVTDYSNRFQFGMYMFPSDTLCAPGMVVNGVPSSPAQIQTSFNSAGPGGGTPTAVAIAQVQQYLASLQLPVPAYILVVTDGEPNCDTGLDGATCQCTSNDYVGCDPGSVYCDANGQNCSYGNELNCLDATSTESAAAGASGAGYPVYVVGFGSQSDVYNNKQVLDAIAQSGGTSQSYTATDQASLTSVLDAVAGSITTCCTDACSQGQTRCSASGGAVERCELDAASGCYGWVPSQSCGNSELCVDNGSAVCTSCSNSCTPGATRCNAQGTEIDTCVAASNGCTSWQSTTTCGSGEICANGACTNGCAGCNPGDVQCSGNDVQTCEAQSSGCNGWVTTRTCASNELCIATPGSGQCCSDSCTPGASRCGASGELESCVAGAAGACPAWQSSACGAGTTCVDGHCDAPCDTSSELASCPSGYSCSQTSQGMLCVPDSAGSSGGSSGSTGSSGSGSTTTSTSGGSSGGKPAASSAAKKDVHSGGCSTGDGLALLALLPLVALTRRRARQDAAAPRP